MKRRFKLAIIIFLFASIYPLYQLFQIYQSSQSFSAQAEAKEYRYRLVLISPYLGDSYWNQTIEGVEKAAAESNVSLDIKGTNLPDNEELIKAMNMAISSKVDGIMLLGIDDPSFSEIIQKATMKGIPVITIMADLPGSLRKAFIGSNHYETGLELGNYLKKNIKDGETIGIVKGNKVSSIEELRLKGLRDSTQTSKIKLVKTEKQHAEEQTNELLNQYPTMKVLIGTGIDDGDLIVRTIESRSTLGSYKIFTFDDTRESINLLRSGKIAGTIHHGHSQMGQKSVETIVKWLEKKDLPLPVSTYVETKVITDGEKESGS
ncbi:substrate-binding domain-containing protein [Metabacillus dongyingensis]|uniref:sugar ABC transporter substrate-binding protein n=1 Tax=Metabacillus dongyingensis TaxID=2874282 RepID=UPI003B8DA810